MGIGLGCRATRLLGSVSAGLCARTCNGNVGEAVLVAIPIMACVPRGRVDCFGRELQQARGPQRKAADTRARSGNFSGEFGIYTFSPFFVFHSSPFREHFLLQPRSDRMRFPFPSHAALICLCSATLPVVRHSRNTAARLAICAGPQGRIGGGSAAGGASAPGPLGGRRPAARRHPPGARLGVRRPGRGGASGALPATKKARIALPGALPRELCSPAGGWGVRAERWWGGTI